jgi:hypothetical protein
VGLEQRDCWRRRERTQKGPRGIDVSCLGTDAGGEDDVALQFRRQPADQLDAGCVVDRGKADDDEIRLAARERSSAPPEG